MFFLFVRLVLATTLTITHAASLNTNAYYIHSSDSCKSCTKDMLFFGDTLILLNGGKYMVGIDLDVCESVLLEPQVLMNQNVPSVFETPVDVVFVPQYNAKLINGDASMSFLDDELFAATVENKYDGFVVTCSSSSIVRLDKKYILRICPDGRGLQIPPGLADSIFDYQMVIRHKTATILNKRNIMLIEEPKIYLATESADYTRHLQFKVSALSIIDSEFDIMRLGVRLMENISKGRQVLKRLRFHFHDRLNVVAKIYCRQPKSPFYFWNFASSDSSQVSEVTQIKRYFKAEMDEMFRLTRQVVCGPFTTSLEEFAAQLFQVVTPSEPYLNRALLFYSSAFEDQFYDTLNNMIASINEGTEAAAQFYASIRLMFDEHKRIQKIRAAKFCNSP